MLSPHAGMHAQRCLLSLRPESLSHNPCFRRLPSPPLHPSQACGFYPQVGRLLPRPPNDAKARATVLTRKDERARIHPASINVK